MGLTLAEVFSQHAGEYIERFGERMLPSHYRAIRAIVTCQTEALGGHVYYCPDCGETLYRYHSCRNRHYPKCHGGRTQRWLAAQQQCLLPVPYFLLTFTLPKGLRRLARSQQKLIYNLLMRVSAQAAQRLGRDERYVGGEIGLLGVLHTWGRDLSYHPHVHYLVPGGGIGPDGRWRAAQKRFLMPVKALSKMFRGSFRRALRREACYAEIPQAVWRQKWVVHCQAVGDGRRALRYLTPYIFRVAISDRRLVKLKDGRVLFRYRPTGTQEWRVMSLSTDEFIRRFLQHVLPKGFVKVRYYGLFSPAYRKRLAALHEQLAIPGEEETKPSQDVQVGPVCCPVCGQPMQCRSVKARRSRSPPMGRLSVNGLVTQLAVG